MASDPPTDPSTNDRVTERLREAFPRVSTGYEPEGGLRTWTVADDSGNAASLEARPEELDALPEEDLERRLGEFVRETREAFERHRGRQVAPGAPAGTATAGDPSGSGKNRAPSSAERPGLETPETAPENRDTGSLP